MDRTQEIETVEEWHIRIRCSVEEVPYIAPAVGKIAAGITGCYVPDTVHVHQALAAPRAAPAVRPSPVYQRSRFAQEEYE